MPRTQTDPAAAIIEATTQAARTDATAALSELAALRSLVDGLTVDYVEKCRREGRSWAQIGACLGVSKQAAHERYGQARPVTDDRGQVAALGGYVPLNR